jgi:hypothetical protein
VRRETLKFSRLLTVPNASITPSEDRRSNSGLRLVLPASVPATPRTLERRAVIAAAVLAVVAWLLALWLRDHGVNVWFDQVNLFRRGVANFMQPYTVGGFVHPPWILPLIAPFSLLPLELSVLVQALCYFLLMAVIIYRFGGDFTAVLITLTSFIAVDAVIEMNVDWFALIGLVVPIGVSPVFLLLKPQLALGYYFGVHWRKWPLILAVGIFVVVLSSLIWPNWIFDILDRVQSQSLQRFFNLAPSKLLPLSPFLSWIVGMVLAWWSFRRQDPPLGILAWFFFTPYIALYSLVLLLGILAIRWRLLAIILSLSMWIIYGAAFFLN